MKDLKFVRPDAWFGVGSLFIVATVLWSGVGCVLSPSGVSPVRSEEPRRVETEERHSVQDDHGRLTRVEGALDLETLDQIARSTDPVLRSLRRGLEAVQQEREATGALPDPVIAAMIENAPFRGKTTGDAEYVAGVTQSIPLGGRLGKDRAIAVEKVEEWMHRLREREVELRGLARGAFAGALFARDRLRIEQELEEQSSRLIEIARGRLEGGAITAEEFTRTELEGLQARVDAVRARAEYRRSVEFLAAEFHLELPGDVELEGELEQVLSLPDLESLVARVESHPSLERQRAVLRQGEAALILEKAKKIPDLDVSFFYRRFQAIDENGLDAGISFTVPLFDGNEAAIQAARAKRWSDRGDLAELRHEMEVKLKTLHSRLAEELEVSRIHREEILPRSRGVREAAGKRYQAGAISLSEWIQEQRAAREARLTYLEILHRIAVDWAALRELVEGLEADS